MRVDPSAVVALVVFVGYTAVVAALWVVNKVDYATIGDTRSNAIRGIVVPIGIGAALLAIATTWFGWWDEVLVEDPRSGPGWAWVVPGLIAVIVLLRFTTVQWNSAKASSLLPALAAGTLFVGFAEELLTRGIVIVGFRADLTELWVWIGSCALFGLLHGINGLFGQSGTGTVRQIVFAFVMGSSFYVTRQITGTLIVGMVLHAAWDFGFLATSATEGEQSKLAGGLTLVALAVGLVAGGFVAT